MIRTKQVRLLPSPEDGRRILVMRRWPRGLSKQALRAEWIRALAPSEALLDGYLSGRVSWKAYPPRFLAEMKGPEARAALRELAAASRAGETVTLLCQCKAGPEGEAGVHCHRRLLRRLLARRQG